MRTKLNTHGIAIDRKNLDALADAIRSCQDTPVTVWAAWDKATSRFVWDELYGDDRIVWDEGMIPLGGALTTDRQEILDDLAWELGITRSPQKPW